MASDARKYDFIVLQGYYRLDVNACRTFKYQGPMIFGKTDVAPLTMKRSCLQTRPKAAQGKMPPGPKHISYA